jgi:hypothetical protein
MMLLIVIEKKTRMTDDAHHCHFFIIAHLQYCVILTCQCKNTNLVWPGEARTILLLHIISVRPSK